MSTGSREAWKKLCGKKNCKTTFLLFYIINKNIFL